MENSAVNGSAVASLTPQGATSGPDDVANLLTKTHDALKIIHNPYSANQTRQEAQAFLEHVKSLREAPSRGFQLASDKSQSPIVRHYGLALLEHAIRHRWAEYNEEEARYLRNWVLELSQNISKDDPPYLRNKIAQLWVEVAKRSWVAEWVDMDELLVRMWQVPDSAVHKELVLEILEILSDEVFNGDDPVIALREGVLSRASVEIFTPAAVLIEAFPNRQPGPDVRCGEEGWLTRVAQLLNDCLNGDIQGNEDVRSCAIHALSVLYSLLPWAIPKAIAASRCVEYTCNGLAAPRVDIQKVSLPYPFLQ